LKDIEKAENYLREKNLASASKYVSKTNNEVLYSIKKYND